MMKIMPNYYEVLGLQEGASEDAIRKAYRKLSLQHHPDKTKSDDRSKFDAVSMAYRVLTGAESNNEATNPIDEAICNGNMEFLEQIYSNGYDFSVYDIILALENKQTAVVHWLIAHGADPNSPINIKVTCNERVHYYEIDDFGRKSYKGYKDFSLIYNWQTTAFGLAMFSNIEDWIYILIKNPAVSLDTVLIPASGRWEKYETALEHAALLQMPKVLAELLDKKRCKPPEIWTLQSAIDLAKDENFVKYHLESPSLKLLKSYRKKHYRFNIFKLGYNNQWHETVDTSWKATFNALPGNFVQAVKDFVEGIKQLFIATVGAIVDAAKFVYGIGLKIGNAISTKFSKEKSKTDPDQQQQQTPIKSQPKETTPFDTSPTALFSNDSKNIKKGFDVNDTQEELQDTAGLGQGQKTPKGSARAALDGRG